MPCKAVFSRTSIPLEKNVLGILAIENFPASSYFFFNTENSSLSKKPSTKLMVRISNLHYTVQVWSSAVVNHFLPKKGLTSFSNVFQSNCLLFSWTSSFLGWILQGVFLLHGITDSKPKLGIHLAKHRSHLNHCEFRVISLVEGHKFWIYSCIILTTELGIVLGSFFQLLSD